jgi:hypothetical protein
MFSFLLSLRVAKEERADVDAADISEFVSLSLSLSLALSFFSAFAANFVWFARFSKKRLLVKKRS